MDVIPLNPSKKSEAARVLAHAFFDYPMIQYYWPDIEQRSLHLEWNFKCAVNYGLRYGVVHTNPEISGIAVWLPPGETKITTMRYVISGFLPLLYYQGVKQFFKEKACDDLVVQVHESIMPDPHWYLWILGVEPEHQGEGIATKLLQAWLYETDRNGLPCYLETHAEENHSFYSGVGFELTRTVNVPGSDLVFWCYLRKPQMYDQ